MHGGTLALVLTRTTLKTKISLILHLLYLSYLIGYLPAVLYFTGGLSSDHHPPKSCFSSPTHTRKEKEQQQHNAMYYSDGESKPLRGTETENKEKGKNNRSHYSKNEIKKHGEKQ